MFILLIGKILKFDLVYFSFNLLNNMVMQETPLKSGFVLSLFSSVDDIKGKYPKGTFCGYSWNDWSDIIKPEDIWNSEPQTLWRAKLFPVFTSSSFDSSVELVLWLQHGPHQATNRKLFRAWKNSTRVSLQVIYLFAIHCYCRKYFKIAIITNGYLINKA